MRVLHVSWEYPPIVYGGLGRHVQALTRAQAERGDDVTVLTQTADREPSVEVVDGIRVIRAPHDPPDVPFSEETLLAWVMGMETGMIRTGASAGPVDIVHAHDWVTSHAAIALREIIDARALVATIHATEAGRHSGWVSGAISRQVHASESWLALESDSLIACSTSMADEITELFGPGLAEITVIPNGIDSTRWPFATRKPHTGPAELLYFGRLEYEKGIHELIAALPRIRRTHPGTTLTIAGDGTQQDWLVELARKHKVLKCVRFAGRAEHEQLLALLHRVDIAVLPSHYEPFGIVALEAAAAGTPLVTSDVGGLGEAVIDGRTGLSFPPRDVAALADAVRAVLDDPAAAQRRAVAARERLTSDFDWHTVAVRTAGVYLAAKRREREPHPRRPIVEHALPDR